MKVIYNKILPFKGFAAMNLFGIILAREECKPLSRVTLNHAVMAQFGVSANHLLKQRLVAALKNEFLFSNRSVSQLAYLFHFSDASHLMRFFKQQTGKTFTQYYRDYQQGDYE